MKYNKTLALIPALFLAACGGEEQTINEPMGPGSVIYSYPADGQSGVSPKADVVLRFSHPVTDTEVDSKIRISSGGNDLAFSSTPVDGGRSLMIELANGLTTGSDYTIVFDEAIEVDGGEPVSTPNAVGAEGIQFSTRAAYSGIASLDQLSPTFEVAGMVPDASTAFQAMNFSTFRLTLTQPIHPKWESMGGSIVLTNSNDEPVPATVLVNGRQITVDPCLADSPERCGMEEDVLTAGETYTLSLENLPSLQGETLTSFSQEFTPRDTGPTVVLKQSIVDSGLASDPNPRTSRLNGEVINGVTLNSVLQGTTDTSQQTGSLFAELGFAPSFEADEALPLRVPKGSVLTSSSLDVKINGTVPVINPATGSLQTTGDIKVTMLSDASGYLMPNPYTDASDAPRHLRLFMDVSMNTEAAQPNASLSQDLLGVELAGIAIVEDGVLTIDAIGMVEPNLLGQEFTDSTIAFRIEASTSADSQLDASEERDADLQDTTGPQLVSWMPGPDEAFPGNRDQMQRPGDPVILNFDEPLDPASIANGISITAGGTVLSVQDGNLEAKLDGTVLVLNPVGGLDHGLEYNVQIASSLTDLAGNGAISQALSFELPDLGTGAEPQRSPIALTTYPGYPCVTSGVDLNDGTHGQCLDDAPGGLAGDVLPVTTLPEDRPIVVVFSQSMDLDSIRLGETFTVEKVDLSGAVIETVAGRLEKNNQRIRFYPDQAWEVGAHYRYVLASQDQGECVDGATSGFICGENGLALETDLLVDPDRSGGPDMPIYFRGIESTNSVFTPLRNLPIRDTNSNYVVDCDTLGSEDCLEPFNHESDGNGGFKPSANAARLSVVDQEARALGVPVGASVGCPADEDCPRNKFIYQTYGLNTEVMGPVFDGDGNKVGVRVLLYPTMLATTSASVFLDGFGEQATGPQILRMRYGTPTEDNPLGLVEGIIAENEQGNPVFRTTADLTLDAPNLQLPLAEALEHNLYSKAFTLELEGPIDFFDDGRMQIVQINSNVPPINVNVNVTIPIIGEFLSYSACVEERGFTGIFTCLADSSTEEERGDIRIPLVIPAEGVYLNFLSNPIKEIPAEQ